MVLQLFFGKIVRIDLQRMENVTNCSLSVRSQSRDPITKEIITIGESDADACVTILDLGSLHERAVGYMKGFTGTVTIWTEHRSR
jgi:hypothetical protein